MLVLGHTGITLGTAVLLDSALSRRCPLPTSLISPRSTQKTKPSLLSKIDLRFLLIGSLLPDIIDKPIGWLFFDNGRIFGHTLLFLLIITLGGIYLYHRYQKTWLLGLSFGTFTHLILDHMWSIHKTLLWPIYGFAFEKADLTYLWSNIFHGLFSSPAVYVPEIIGAGILIWFVLMLVYRRKVYEFIRNGLTS